MSEVCAQLKYLRVSSRKAQQVVDLVRGKSVSDALSTLEHTRRACSLPIMKLIKSAAANAEETGEVQDVDTLFIKEIFVNQGPTMRRFRPRARGRATRIRKRTSHISVVLSD